MSVLAALSTVRFLFSLSAMTVFGASFLLALLARTPLRKTLAEQLGATIRALAVLAMLSALAWLPLQCALIGDSWQSAGDTSMLTALLTGTDMGSAWAIRFALSLLTLGVAWVGTKRDRPFSMTWIALVSGASVASLALSGHAASNSGSLGFLHQTVDALHVLSAGAWTGAMLPFFMLLRAVKRQTAQRREASAALMRFSTMGHFAVAGTLISGALNTWLILGDWPADWPRHWPSLWPTLWPSLWPFDWSSQQAAMWTIPMHTPYQWLLSVKILLALVMTVLALSNRYRWVPLIRTDSALAAGKIRRRAWINVALGIAVIALVAVFGVLSPSAPPGN